MPATDFHHKREMPPVQLGRAGKGFLLVVGGALTLLQVKLSFDAGDNLRDFLGEQKGAKDFQKGQEAWTGKQPDTAAGQKR